VVRDHIEKFIRQNIDSQTETAFKRLFIEKKLLFYLECAQCRYEIPSEISVRAGKRMAHDDGDLTEKSLFDFVNEEDSNSLERAVALCLDRDENVLWWYRNLVGEQSFAIQGYKRDRLYPDFVAQSAPERGPRHVVWVIESKGEHLQGSTDTQYKRDVASMFGDVGRRVTWQQLGEDFKDHTFCFHILDEAQEHGREMKDQLRELLRVGE
jgi:type III restriction enzyme